MPHLLQSPNVACNAASSLNSNQQNMRLIFTTLFCLTISVGYCQTKSYTTTKIAFWTLEKFPKHFLIKPAKVYSEKTKGGRITYYQQLNEYGKADGLTIRIQKDYSSPHTVYYYRKGVVVYRATFFDRSTKADEIVNKNLDDQKDGPQLTREILSNNDIQEIIEEYKDGELVSTNKPEEPVDVANFENGLLEGKFRISCSNYTVYEGIAKQGIVLSWKETYMTTDIINRKIIGDSLYSSTPKGQKMVYEVSKRRKITNDNSLGNDPEYEYCDNVCQIPQALK